MEIKFRGKKINNSGWIYGMPTYDFRYIFNGEQLDSVDNYEVTPETVSQFTGASDRKCKAIYDKDILRFHDDFACPENVAFYRVFWSEDDLQWCVGQPQTMDSFPLWELDLDYAEVIGNTYDNPELLN